MDPDHACELLTHVAREGFKTSELGGWITRGVAFAGTRPPKR